MLRLGSLLLAVVAVQKSAPSDLEKVELDALIAMLPPAGCEGAATTELRRRLSGGLKMTDAQWERALLVSETVRFRSKWPANLRLALSVHEPRWTIESGVETGGTHVSAVPRTAGLKEVEGGELMHLGCGTFEDARRKIADYQEIGRLSPGPHRIVFDVFVDTLQGMGPTRSSPVRWTGPVVIDVEIVPSIEQAIPAIDTPELRDLVRRSLCRFPPADADIVPPSVLVAFSAEGPDAQVLADTAISLEIALYRKDEFLGSGSTRVIQFGGFRPCQTPKSRWGADGVELGPIRPPAPTRGGPLADLEVRARGVSKNVLMHWGARGWWNGTVSVPLTDLPVHR